jgi:hypothetical protein
MKRVTIIFLIAAEQRNSGGTAGNTVTVHKIINGGTMNVLNHI